MSKHIDFVAVDPDDLSILFVVELDDNSHQRADRQKRDSFVDNALDAAGVTLIRFPAKYGYVVEEIRQEIFHA
jgi:very-short-patch-repair endonuclease